MKALEEKYLEGLSELFPSIAAASTEIINLQAIVNLPKGTEHFLTDIHGEYEAFAHVLKNGSGSVKRKVDDVFANTMSSRDKQTLATLIYYPREKMERIDRETAHEPFLLNIAVNYGGREEIAHACGELLREGKTSVTEEDISAHLYTAGCPDPDLIVRTGGDLRSSNFLLWQSAYAEYYFTDTLWPDYSERDVDEAVRSFLGRKRRFGGVKNV